MARAASQDIVVLGSRRKARLEAITRRPSSPQALVRRARIVLLAHQGWSESADRRGAGLLGGHGADLAAPVRPWRHPRPWLTVRAAAGPGCTARMCGWRCGHRHLRAAGRHDGAGACVDRW